MVLVDLVSSSLLVLISAFYMETINQTISKKRLWNTSEWITVRWTRSIGAVHVLIFNRILVLSAMLAFVERNNMERFGPLIFVPGSLTESEQS
jgi:hypothetical protein